MIRKILIGFFLDVCIYILIICNCFVLDNYIKKFLNNVYSGYVWECMYFGFYKFDFFKLRKIIYVFFKRFFCFEIVLLVVIVFCSYKCLGYYFL